MPYVDLAPATRASRKAEAEARWAALGAAQPDLGPAILLQSELIAILLDLVESVEAGGLPRLSLPPKYVAAKLDRGIPALIAEPIPIPGSVLTPALGRLCDVLAGGGAGEAASHLGRVLAEGRIDGASLLSASLSRNQQAIRAAAHAHSLAPDLLWLVAELAVSPLAYLLQRRALATWPAGTAESGAALKRSLHDWTQGYCPACASWPGVGEIVNDRRVLRCSFCACGWVPAPNVCIYCGDPRVTWVPDSIDVPSGRRIESCGACAGYLKSIRLDALSPFPLVAVSDLATAELDLMAMQAGLVRPPMREFTARR
jgi:hypothetical protein